VKTGDFGPILDPTAALEVRRLIQLSDDVGTLEVCARLYWHRWQFTMFGPGGRDDLRAALVLFAAIAGDRPDSIPPDVVTIWRSDDDDDATDAIADYSVGLLSIAAAGGVDEARLDEIVSLLTSAADRTPVGDPQYPARQSNLSAGLQLRYTELGREDDLPDAVAAARLAVDAASKTHPEYFIYLSTLAGALKATAIANIATATAAEALRVMQAAVDATPMSDPRRQTMIGNAEDAYEAVFRLSRSPDDLDAAIDFVGWNADTSRSSESSSTLSHLLAERFEITGHADDLDTALIHAQRVVDATDEADSRYLFHLTRWGNLLRHRAESDPNPAAADTAVRVLRTVVDSAPSDDASYGIMLNNLGLAMQTRFDVTGRLSDIQEAVRLLRAAVDHGGSDGFTLANLSRALRVRGAAVRSLPDTEEAVRTARQAVHDVEPDHPSRPLVFSHLGMALINLYERTDDQGDLEAGILALQEAIDHIPAEHYMRQVMLSALGTAYLMQADRSESIETLDRGIAVLRQSVNRTDQSGPARGVMLAHLADALQRRHRLSGLGDLDECVALTTEAVHTVTADHPYAAGIHEQHADSSYARYRRDGSPIDLTNAVTAWDIAADVSSAPATVRLSAARSVADATARHFGPAEAVPRYQRCLDLLPLLAWAGNTDADVRHLVRSRAASLGRDAAACAIAAGDPELAVELLESGRGLYWAHVLRMRSDISDLEMAAPDLAADLASCRAILEASPFIGSAHPSSDQPREQRIAAAERFAAIVDEVRRLPPSAALPRPDLFLRPPGWRDLTRPRDRDRIVMINISQWRCDALVIAADGLSLVELPHLSATEVLEATRRYQRALDQYGQRSAAGPDALMLEMALSATLRWLWDKIVVPILGPGGLDAGELPRIWWCPTGPLAYLPVHAAGHHDRPGESLFDRAISSYTPGLRTFAASRRRDDSGTLLAIVIPDTPDQSPLPYAQAELEALQAAFPAERLDVLRGDHATHDAIRLGLAAHPWVHAACHGTFDPFSPHAGGLLPFDWQTRGSVGIADILRPGHPVGSFIFLSACRTAATGVNVDESLTVPAALRHAGWGHVIGTLWSVDDAAATAISRAVYPLLITDGRLEADRSAYALHASVRELRAAYPQAPSRWAPFVHIGP
jgi:CHAT domain-containing protein